MSGRTIPTVDLSKFVHGNAEERSAFVDKLGKAFHEVGFVGVVNHGIDKQLVDDFYNASKSFFSQPVGIKRKYEIEGLSGQRGYTAFGREHAKQSQVADLKEFFQIGQWVSDDHPLKHEYPDNVVTEETPEFYNKGKELYKSFEESGGHLLRAIALHLNLEENYFEDPICREVQ